MSDGLECFDGFTRKAAADGMFNDEQVSWMRYLSWLPPDQKCRCGWYQKWDCYNCNRAALELAGVVRDDRLCRRWRGNGWSSDDPEPLCYRLPTGIMTGYRGAVEWLKRQEDR